MPGANYRIEEQTEDRIVIRDVGKNSMSVTNDAEDVVHTLELYGVLNGRHLFYYDSEGRLDEILHDGKGGFLGFAPGPRC